MNINETMLMHTQGLNSEIYSNYKLQMEFGWSRLGEH